jgi:hypothetical protein
VQGDIEATPSQGDITPQQHHSNTTATPSLYLLLLVTAHSQHEVGKVLVHPPVPEERVEAVLHRLCVYMRGHVCEYVCGDIEKEDLSCVVRE